MGHGSFGASGGTRTHTVSPPTDFESVTSTIPSHWRKNAVIIQDIFAKFKPRFLFPAKFYQNLIEGPADSPGAVQIRISSALKMKIILISALFHKIPLET